MRHLMIIVDWMTWAGGITALNRHGVKKMMGGATPVKRATFEPRSQHSNPKKI